MDSIEAIYLCLTCNYTFKNIQFSYLPTINEDDQDLRKLHNPSPTPVCPACNSFKLKWINYEKLEDIFQKDLENAKDRRRTN